MTDTSSGRRDLLLLPLLLPFLAALARTAEASPLDPSQTIIVPPEELKWIPNAGYPDHSVDMCPLYGSTNAAGLYYTLVRWWPGYMSVPHTHTSDRLCVVVSGTGWCNSGADFDPAACVSVQAGSFVRRVAGTPHHDGVISGHDVPAIIAICGIGPVNYKLSDPTLPG